MRIVLVLSLAVLASACAPTANNRASIFSNPVAAATSCSATGSRTCCCKDIGGDDCIVNTAGCGGTYPIPILLP